MHYCLVYRFEHLRVEIWEVPEGRDIDDIAGKFFSMDNEEDITSYTTLDAARQAAKVLLEKDLKRVQEKFDGILTQMPEKPRGRYPKEEYEEDEE